MMCNFNERFKNVKYLHEGAFRKAFTFGKNDECVIKLPHNNHDGEHNLNEAIAWKSMPNHVRKHFVPVLDYDNEGNWLIMPRVTSIELSDDERRELQGKVMDDIKKKGVWCEDIHIYNVGKDNRNKPVILDYGFGCRKAEKDDGVIKPIQIFGDEFDYDFSKLDFFGK